MYDLVFCSIPLSLFAVLRTLNIKDGRHNFLNLLKVGDYFVLDRLDLFPDLSDLYSVVPLLRQHNFF